MNTNVVATFEKVSFETFAEDVECKFSINHMVKCMDLKKIYDEIQLPKRATARSAGYDFFYPFDKTSIREGGTLLIPTGIKCRIDDGWWLGMFPRSSLGTKFNMRLENTIGVIDSDYYNNDGNEGHIMACISNNDRQGRILTLDKGMAFCQCILIPFGIATNDNSNGKRAGGFGSTGK